MSAMRKYGVRILGSASLLAAVAGLSLDYRVSQTALSIWDPSDITSLFTTNTGETQVAADGDTIGLMLDTRYAKAAGFATVADWITSLANDRDDGVVGLVGTATVATYNTATGEALISRVDASNQSYVQFPAASQTLHRFVVENTGSATISMRQTPTSGVLASITAGQTATLFVHSGAETAFTLTTQSGQTNSSFTVHEFKSVPGYHRAQATNGKRPLYRISGALRSLQYDGLDDCLPTIAAVNLTGTDALAICAGVRKLSDAATGTVCEFGASVGSTAGSFRLAAPNAASTSASCASRGTALAQAIYTDAAATAPITMVLAGLSDISADTCLLRLNGAQVATDATDQGTGNYTSQIVNFGARNNSTTSPFNGHEYGVILQSSLADAATIALYEQWANLRSAAY